MPLMTDANEDHGSTITTQRVESSNINHHVLAIDIEEKDLTTRREGARQLVDCDVPDLFL